LPTVILSLMNIQINWVRLVFLGSLPHWLFVSLGLVLRSFVLVVRLRNTCLPPLLVCDTTQHNIVYIFNGVSFVAVIVLSRILVRLENFAIVFVLTTLIRLLALRLSIHEGFLIRSSWGFRNMSKLLVVIRLIVALTITSAFRRSLS